MVILNRPVLITTFCSSSAIVYYTGTDNIINLLIIPVHQKKKTETYSKILIYIPKLVSQACMEALSTLVGLGLNLLYNCACVSICN